MSGVVILTPIIVGAAWPVVISATAAVMAAMGYVAVNSTVHEGLDVQSGIRAGTEVEVELTNQEEVGQTVARGEELVFTKDDITVKFTRDIRGRMKVCVSGENHAKAELEELGRELAGRVIQQYAYNRLMMEMKNKTGMSIVDQSVDEDDNIHIKLRSWED